MNILSWPLFGFTVLLTWHILRKPLDENVLPMLLVGMLAWGITGIAVIL